MNPRTRTMGKRTSTGSTLRTMKALMKIREVGATQVMNQNTRGSITRPGTTDEFEDWQQFERLGRDD